VARRSLIDLMKTYETLPGGVKKARGDFVDEILVYMFERYQKHLEDDQFEEAERMLANIAECEAEFKDVIDISGPLIAADRVLADKKKSFVLKVAEENVASRRYGEARIALLYAASEPGLSGSERDLIRDLDSRLPDVSFAESIKALKQDQERYLQLDISDEEASRTLEFAEQILKEAKDAPSRIAVFACAIASASKLSQADAANALLERLQKEKIAKTDLIRTLQRLTKEATDTLDSETGAARGRIKPAEQDKDRRRRRGAADQ
jgi:hypothetical protein